MKFKLSKPLQLTAEKSVNEVEVKDLDLATVDKINELPFTFTAKGTTEIKPAVMKLYIAELTGIEPAIVRQMQIGDFLKIASHVSSFFTAGA